MLSARRAGDDCRGSTILYSNKGSKPDSVPKMIKTRSKGQYQTLLGKMRSLMGSTIIDTRTKGQNQTLFGKIQPCERIHQVFIQFPLVQDCIPRAIAVVIRSPAFLPLRSRVRAFVSRSE